jgi:hypothetical protein
LKGKNLKRGNPFGRRGEKSPRFGRDETVLGNTLESRQAHGRTSGSCESFGRLIEEEYLRLLRKGDRGMSVKPIG